MDVRVGRVALMWSCSRYLRVIPGSDGMSPWKALPPLSLWCSALAGGSGVSLTAVWSQ